ncbi:MAG: acetate--CoA ligase family protein [Pyrobaculum sp.]
MGVEKLREDVAFALLESYHISVLEYRIVNDEVEAVSAAEQIGYPVVAKIVSTKILHKTEVGGVLLNLNNPREVREAYRRLSKIGDGVLIQKMASGGVEVMVGATYDEIFGHVILFGLGGIYTELYRDMSIRIAPIERRDAWDMVRETKAFHILSGYRGMPPRDVAAVVDILTKFSQLAVERGVLQADLNPVFVLEKGAYVADARVIIKI